MVEGMIGYFGEVSRYSSGLISVNKSQQRVSLSAMFSLLGLSLFSSSLVYSPSLVSASAISGRSSHCQPYHYDFTASTSLGSSFVSATADSKFDVNSNGLELFLTRPNQPVKSSKGINNILGQGSTINSTFTFL